MEILANREPITRALDDAYSSGIQEWELPLDDAYLSEMLIYIFTNYWEQVIFGPDIPGAGYEMTCPQAPTFIDYSNGYLTMNFGEQHFHICLGTGGHPYEGEKRNRLPGRAVIFRRLDAVGAPISWGFEMWNQASHSMITVYFANPYADRGDKLIIPAQYERLEMWKDISQRYLGRENDPFDASGKGYQDMSMGA